MKKIKIILLAIIASTLTFSCSNDDNDSSSSASIIGTWQWTSSNEDGSNVILTECDLLDTIIFTDTQFTFVSHNSDNDSAPCTTESLTGTYSITGNIISTLYDEDGEVESQTAEITTLNSTTLVIKSEDTFNGQPSVDIDTYTRK